MYAILYFLGGCSLGNLVDFYFCRISEMSQDHYFSQVHFLFSFGLFVYLSFPPYHLDRNHLTEQT